MAVAFDAFADAGAPATDPSWTHTPAGTPAGVFVFVIQDGALPETVSCTYGGTAMTALTPIDGSLNTEPARIYPFFLGASVPTGAQTVAVTADGLQTKGGGSYTVTAAADTEVDVEGSLVSSSQDDPSVNINTTVTTITFGALFSGLGNSSNITADANHTKDLSRSTLGDSMNSEHRSAVVAAGTVAVGFVTSAADDVVLHAIAVREAAGGTAHSLAGVANGTSSATGAMALGAVLAGAANGAATVTGAIGLGFSLAGAANGTSSVTGALIQGHRLVGESAGSSTVTGYMTNEWLLAGSSAGDSSASGTLLVVEFGASDDSTSMDFTSFYYHLRKRKR